MSSLWPSPDELRHLDDGVPPAREYLRWLRDVINRLDRAMDAEGIASTSRARVVSRVLHDTPTPGDTPAWDEPAPQDLAVLDALADGPLREPACTFPPVNAAGW